MYLQKTFNIHLYDAKIQLIISDNIAEVYNRIQKKHNTESRWKDSPAGCVVGLSMDKYYILISSAYLNYNTILHELLHCVKALTFDRGIFEEETMCWIQGEIGSLIFNFIKSKNIELI